MSNTREYRLRTYRRTLETLKIKYKHTNDINEQRELKNKMTELEALIQEELYDDGGKYII